jgi:glycosyltransferase involved in cell wall biosynthesis
MREEGKTGKKLTIAHIMPWSGVGGVEIATLRLMDTTRDQFRHVAFCLHDATPLRNSLEKMGIETITYSPPVPSLRHAVKYYKESLAVKRQLQAIGADIVHFAEINAAEFNSLAAVLAQCRLVSHVRNTYPHLGLRQRLPLLLVHSFIFVSKESMQRFAISLPDNKARVVYDAIELPDLDIAANNAAVRQELRIPAGCSVVGTVARVNPQKDYFTLAAAAAEVLSRHPDTRFLIVGDNSLVELNRQHYKEVARELNKFGIADNFIFTGHRSDVPRLIAAMDFCVLCTHREGFPLSILESMAMRKPVIATAVGGIPEIITPGVTGYLHQHGDSNELAGEIISLIEDPAKTSQLGLAAYENVRENYSRQKFADEMSEAYWDVMRR